MLGVVVNVAVIFKAGLLHFSRASNAGGDVGAGFGGHFVARRGFVVDGESNVRGDTPEHHILKQFIEGVNSLKALKPITLFGIFSFASFLNLIKENREVFVSPLGYFKIFMAF